MDSSSQTSRMQLRRSAEAGLWLLRLEEDQLAESQLEEWLRWSTDAENLAEFERLQSLYGGLRQHGRIAKRAVNRWNRNRRWMLAAAAGLVLALGTGIALRSPLQRPFGFAAQTYSTGKAVHRELALSDSSRAVLGASSKLVIDYDAERRHVRVEGGEVYFEVVKDSRRPFVVEAGGLEITAVGTAFNVRRSDDQVEVMVAEGAVEAQRRASMAHTPQPVATQVLVHAGERLTMRPAAAALVVASVNPSTAANWRYGRLEFVGEPLHVVVASLNRYLPSEIRIGDVEVGDWLYSGTVQPTRVDEWLDALREVFPVRAVRQPDGAVILQRKSSS